MAMWYPGKPWYHGIIHNSAWSLRLELEFLDEADQEQKQLCLGYTFPRADPFANLEWNHPLIPLVFSILNEPCGVKLGGICPGVMSHHDFMQQWKNNVTRGNCVWSNFYRCFVHTWKSIRSCIRTWNMWFQNSFEYQAYQKLLGVEFLIWLPQCKACWFSGSAKVGFPFQ